MNAFSKLGSQNLSLLYKINTLNKGYNYSTYLMLTVYWNLVSQPARAVKALADIGKLQAKFVDVDVMKGETSTEEYKKLNPFGKIPFVHHGDFGLAESNAILAYLCQVYPEQLGKYYGDTPQTRALVNQYLSWYQGTFRVGLVQLIYLKYQKMTKKTKLMNFQLEYAEELMKKTISSLEDILIKSSPYITGDHPTIADILVFFEVTDLFIVGIPLENYKATHAWFNKMLEIEALAAIHNEYQKSLPKLMQMFQHVKADDA